MFNSSSCSLNPTPNCASHPTLRARELSNRIFFNCYIRGVCDRGMGVVSRAFAELGCWVGAVGLAQGSREVESDTKETRRAG